MGAPAEKATEKVVGANPVAEREIDSGADGRVESSASRSSIDRIIELYKRDIDRTLLREQLRKTPDQRVRELVELERFAAELRTAGKKAFR